MVVSYVDVAGQMARIK